MIRTQHRWLAHLIFWPYLQYLFRKHFQRLLLPNQFPVVDENKSVLLVANHFSWWDGFFWYYVNRKLLKRKFHLMMLEEQLSRFWFFKFLGAFSVKKGTRSVAESLEYAAQLLNDPQNLVLIFPQGEIQAQFQQQLNMQKGIAVLFTRTSGVTQLLGGAVFTHYGSQPKPTAFFYLQRLSEVNDYPDFFMTSQHNAASRLPK